MALPAGGKREMRRPESAQRVMESRPHLVQNGDQRRVLLWSWFDPSSEVSIWQWMDWAGTVHYNSFRCLIEEAQNIQNNLCNYTGFCMVVDQVYQSKWYKWNKCCLLFWFLNVFMSNFIMNGNIPLYILVSSVLNESMYNTFRAISLRIWCDFLYCRILVILLMSQEEEVVVVTVGVLLTGYRQRQRVPELFH